MSKLMAAPVSLVLCIVACILCDATETSTVVVSDLEFCGGILLAAVALVVGGYTVWWFLFGSVGR